MKESKPILDANIIIGFLTADNKSQLKRIESLFENSKNNSLFIPDVIILEVVYVLKSVYKFSREDLVDVIIKIIEFDKFDTNYKLMKDVARIFSENNISFVDAYISAMTLRESYSKVYTFDKEILKVKEIKAEKP